MLTRRYTQIAGLLIANPWFFYFKSRILYRGSAKGFCIPLFNCYSCPLAMYACPIGSLQQSLSVLSAGAFLYVAGVLGAVGAMVGRMLCGWACPFGFIQDLLYKVPLPKFRLPGWARFGKYATLLILVILLPLITKVHWFSRLCPVGTLEGGIPLQILPPGGAPLGAGVFFWIKIAILAVFLLWMMVTKRPFCRAACPLGAIFALFNPVSLYRMDVDRSACNNCGKCREVCPVDIDITDNPNSPECIRCLDCKKACPLNAISSGFRLGKATEETEGREGASSMESRES